MPTWHWQGPESECPCGPGLAHPGPGSETKATRATGRAQVSQRGEAELATEVILSNKCWLGVGVFPLHQDEGGRLVSVENDPGGGKVGSVGLGRAGAWWNMGPGSAQGSAALPSGKALDHSCNRRPIVCAPRRVCMDV